MCLCVAVIHFHCCIIFHGRNIPHPHVTDEQLSLRGPIKWPEVTKEVRGGAGIWAQSCQETFHWVSADYSLGSRPCVRSWETEVQNADPGPVATFLGRRRQHSIDKVLCVKQRVFLFVFKGRGREGDSREVLGAVGSLETPRWTERALDRSRWPWLFSQLCHHRYSSTTSEHLLLPPRWHRAQAHSCGAPRLIGSKCLSRCKECCESGNEVVFLIVALEAILTFNHSGHSSYLDSSRLCAQASRAFS